MFYYLYEFTNLKLLSYITVRAGAAFFFAFGLCVFLMPVFIRWAKRKHASQPIYELAPENHKKKNHTPTMGGLVFVASTIVAILLTAHIGDHYVQCGIYAITLFALIGFIDDRAKILGASNHAGLSPRAKFALQWIFAFFVAGMVYAHSDLNSAFYLPFVKTPLFDMSFFAIPFWALVMVAASNSVNLTDGLDGLATVPAAFALITLGIFAYLVGNTVYANYLLLPKFIGVGELVILVSAFVGALLGFLWYNCYPAQVFMGDTGSLSIGGFMGFMAICTKNELLLLVIGFVFVIETLSVILQVGSFKLRKKRIFLMAPLHHHFEMKGWSENKIIIRFWTIALLANLIALAVLKLR